MGGLAFYDGFEDGGMVGAEVDEAVGYSGLKGGEVLAGVIGGRCWG